MLFNLIRLAGVICILFPTMAFSFPPPKIIQQRNLGADIIVVGDVLEITHMFSDSAFFKLKVKHIIKGHDNIKQGDEIKVGFQPAPSDISGIRSHQMGTRPVKVEKGQLVVGYINPSKTDAGFFEPVLQGLSIVDVGD